MWAGLAALACFSGQPVQAATYSQSYTILINGVPAGSEVVTEKHEGGNIISSSEHEIFVTDGTETKRMAFVAKTVLSKDSARPVSYTCRYTSGGSDDSYEAGRRRAYQPDPYKEDTRVKSVSRCVPIR